VSSARKKQGLIFVISGPSGSGKTTLRDELLKDRQLRYRLVKSISFTTRLKRGSEKNKRDYFFINEKQLKRNLKAKKILEWTKYLDYYYATPRDFVDKQLKKGRNIILCLDLKGASSIKKIYPKNTVRVFVKPPSLKELRDRILKRCLKAKKTEIKNRVRLAKKEILSSSNYDYRIINDDLDRAVKELKGIILSEIKNSKTWSGRRGY
jgi:guanylate kinase